MHSYLSCFNIHQRTYLIHCIHMAGRGVMFDDNVSAPAATMVCPVRLYPEKDVLHTACSAQADLHCETQQEVVFLQQGDHQRLICSEVGVRCV